MFKNKNYKTALVLGAGKSGIAAANLLSKKGFSVYLSDRKKKSELGGAGIRRAVRFITEKDLAGALRKADFAIKSPGISNHAAPLRIIKKAGIPVFSEIETALAFSGSPNLVMITGTNGKTTTTGLSHLIFQNFARKKGRKALACGNIGNPACEQAPKAGPKDYIVMEVSSYQLEDSNFIKPAVSAILNITPDHLEHHGSMASYIKAKAKVFAFQDPEDFCVLNYEDKYSRKLALKCPARVLFFSSKRRGPAMAAFLEKGKIIIRQGKRAFPLVPPPIPGTHNIENAMAAALSAAALGVNGKIIQKTFDAFKGVEHRIEYVRELEGVRYVNDSKGTNVDSTAVALKALGLKKNIWLILGGLDKGTPYGPLSPLIKKHVKKILTVGSAAAKIEKELNGAAGIKRAFTIKKALDLIRAGAEKGDIALLSPACASYDQFRDFEDRGRQFKKMVNYLK